MGVVPRDTDAAAHAADGAAGELKKVGRERRRPPSATGAFGREIGQTARTSLACRPFWPVVTVYSTFWPSARVLKPLPVMAALRKKTSAEPSSGAMKPKPLVSLNHLTVP